MGIKWNKMLITGHEEIDREHKEIITDAKQLLKAIKGKDLNEVEDCLRQFQLHVEEHFISEEAIMEEYQISQLDAHRDLHQKYLRLISDIHRTYIEQGSTSWLKKEFTAACHVMTKHIINYDIPVFNEVQQIMYHSTASTK